MKWIIKNSLHFLRLIDEDSPKPSKTFCLMVLSLSPSL